MEREICTHPLDHSVSSLFTFDRILAHPMKVRRTQALRQGSKGVSPRAERMLCRQPQRGPQANHTRLVAHIFSSSSAQSSKGKTNAGQGLDGNYGRSSQPHRAEVQAQKRQKRLTDGLTRRRKGAQDAELWSAP